MDTTDAAWSPSSPALALQPKRKHSTITGLMFAISDQE
jgi:hypothetical protein